MAEIGVGSGAVIGTLACELPDSELVGVECSQGALAVAAANLTALGVDQRVRLLCGSGVEPAPAAWFPHGVSTSCGEPNEL